ncbi:MAG: HAD-IIA family hydrolase [Anaerolineales bacterium]|nr:HAD-IIA family hydrolase [Anaerolineales bacterium]MCW5856293.1 HAD-IIA family hydrolase [Anaerolineales bacterium]
MTSPAIKALLLDMDGVLWRGDEPIGDVPALLERILQHGMQYAFVTNNATRTVEQYQEKFRHYGAEVAPEHIHTSARVTAKMLSEQYPDGGRVYIIGERGLQTALAERGFQQAESDCLAVVVGLDRELTYAKLRQAALLIQAGAAFIGTNPDGNLPSPEGKVPGAGSILAALQTATGVAPTVIGKPQPALLHSALEQLGVPPEQALMAGDRLDTDVQAGYNARCRTALLLSGVATRDQAEAWQPQPDFIEPDLASLLDKLA